MSGSKSKNTSISHRALDELVRFKTSLVTDIGQFKTEIINAVKDIGEKHNGLAAHVAALEGVVNNTAAFAASELGKIGGTSQRHFTELDRTVSAIDLNVLALAELSKELVGQFSQVDVLLKKLGEKLKFVFAASPEIQTEIDKIFQLTQVEISEIKTSAEKWYGDLVASAFKTVRARMEAEDVARRENETAAQEAAAAAEKVATDQAEVKAVETEIQKANAEDLTPAAAVSGGAGSPFPVGAEIFGS